MVTEKVDTRLEQKEKREVIPEFGRVGPKWWNERGLQMQLYSSSSERVVLRENATGSDGCDLSITARRETSLPYVVAWRVSPHYSLVVRGEVLMSEDELRSAFGLGGVSEEYEDDQLMLGYFGGSSARAWKFIRYKRRLCIPGPGVAWDADGTISIDLNSGHAGDDTIRRAVLNLINPSEPLPKWEDL